MMEGSKRETTNSIGPIDWGNTRIVMNMLPRITVEQIRVRAKTIAKVIQPPGSAGASKKLCIHKFEL